MFRVTDPATSVKEGTRHAPAGQLLPKALAVLVVSLDRALVHAVGVSISAAGVRVDGGITGRGREGRREE